MRGEGRGQRGWLPRLQGLGLLLACRACQTGECGGEAWRHAAHKEPARCAQRGVALHPLAVASLLLPAPACLPCAAAGRERL